MSVGGAGRNALVQARAGRQGVVLDEPAQVPSFVWPIAQVEPVIGFVVYGQPAPQGSKRITYRNGRPVVKEASDSLAPWRDSVRTVARQAIRAWSSRQEKSWEPLDCPVLVQAVLTMPATEASRRRGDVFPTGVPDVDKLERGWETHCLLYRCRLMSSGVFLRSELLGSARSCWRADVGRACCGTILGSSRGMLGRCFRRRPWTLWRGQA